MTKVSRDEKTLEIATALVVVAAVLGVGGILMWLANWLIDLDGHHELSRALGTAVVGVAIGLAVAYLMRQRRRR